MIILNTIASIMLMTGAGVIVMAHAEPFPTIVVFALACLFVLTLPVGGITGADLALTTKAQQNRLMRKDGLASCDRLIAGRLLGGPDGVILVLLPFGFIVPLYHLEDILPFVWPDLFETYVFPLITALLFRPLVCCLFKQAVLTREHLEHLKGN